MPMRNRLIFAFALLCAPAGAFGQALHPDSLFPRLIGHWVLRGTIARQQTVHDVTFEWLLGREYVQMHEISRERQVIVFSQEEDVRRWAETALNPGHDLLVRLDPEAPAA